ncbi:MAG: citrate synthase [Acidimicrobiia bacterium]
MTEATLDYEGNTSTFEVLSGTEGEKGVDISRLRSETGLVTIDKGFANTAETASEVTFINGEEGILWYRGYPIEALAARSTFLEVAYLLYHGELPTKDELEAYQDSISSHTLLREDAKHLFEAFPMDAHPMQILASATSALASYYPDALDPFDESSIAISTTRLIAKMPTIAAWAYKHSMDQPYVYPRNDLEYTTNFLNMMFALPTEAFEVDPVIARALDQLFILHADHGQNCSSSTVRMVGSGQANIFSSMAAGIHALSGPSHGGANQEVVEMLGLIREQGREVQSWVDRAKDRDDPFRLMGFGHRIYKNFDPRAELIKKTASEVLDRLGAKDPLLDIALELEEAALADEYFVERKLYPNVDFYSGIIYRAMGFPTEMFTVLFAIGRLPGWISQWREMNQDPGTRIWRPRQLYVGPQARDYVDIADR